MEFEGSAGAIVAVSQIKAVELDFFSTLNRFSSCFLHAPVGDPFYGERCNSFNNIEPLSETGESRRGVLIPFPRKLFFSNPSSNPTIPVCVPQIEIPFPFFHCRGFFFMNPSPSAQNPISQLLKKANPSSHFTPSRPSEQLDQM